MVALLFFVLAFAEARVTYFGEQVVNCHFQDPSVYPKLSHLDVWGVVNRTIDIRVKNLEERSFVDSLLDGCTVVIEDVEELIRQDEARRNASKETAEWFDDYHSWADLDAWYTNLANTKTYVSYGNISGQTYQGNQLKAVVIDVSKDPSKPKVYMQAQIHAREWIAAATANYIINQLVTDYDAGNPDVVALLQKVNIHLVPVLNIDGYLYTWASNGDRLWRKNRAPTNRANCPGVDINRNYPDHWGQGGSSSSACDDTYMGPSAGSELETQATTNYFKTLQAQARVVAAIDWHSYSQLVLRPYGWTNADSPHEAIFKTQGDAYAASIRSTSGEIYTSEKSIDLYVTTGTAQDWFYGAATTSNGFCTAGYTVELRPSKSPPGFVLPPAQIIPTGNENYRALIPFLTYFANNPLPVISML